MHPFIERYLFNSNAKLPSQFIAFVFIGVVYWITLQFGLLLVVRPEGIASLWPVSGLALAVLLLSPKEMLAKYVALFFIVNAAGNMYGGNSFLVSLGFALANSFESIMGVTIINYICKSKITFERTIEIFALFVAAFFGNAITALLGASVSFFAFDAPFLKTWELWWAADGLGIILVTPFIIAWVTKKKKLDAATRSHLLESIFFIFLLLSFSWLIFGHFTVAEKPLLRTFMLFPILIWSAFRFSLRGMASTLLLVAIIAIWNTILGFGTFAFLDQNVNQHLVSVQIFLTVMVFSGFFLSALILELKRKEDAIKQSGKKEQSILQTAMDGFWMVDVNGKLLQVNEAYCRMSGYTEQELLTMHITDLESAETVTATAEHIQTVITKGEDRFQTKHHKKDGTVFVVEVNVQFKHVDGGRFVVFLQEITERKRAEEKLQKSEEHIKTIFETLSEGVALNEMVFNNTGEMIDYTILEVNEAFYKTADFRDDEIVVGNRASKLYGMDNKVIKDFWKNHKHATNTIVTEYISPISKRTFSISTSPFINNRFATSFQDITESKIAENNLKESEEKYRLLYESNQMPIAIFETESLKFLSVNDAFVKKYGYTREEFLTMTILEIRPDFEIEKVKQSIKINDNGLVNLGEFLHKKKNGEIIQVEIIRNDIDFEGKKAKLVFANDITERKQAEEKIREKDIQFRKLSANVPDLIFQFTRRPDGTYFVPVASEGIKNIFGCSPEDVINDFTPIGRVIYPEDTERVISDIEYSAKHLTFFTCEFRVQIPGKPIQWIYSRSTPEKLADGSVTWFGFNTDISERKRAEDLIHESEEKYRNLIQYSGDPIFSFNPDETYKFVNEAFAKPFGKKPEEIIGKKPHDIFTHDEAEKRLTLIRQVFQTGQKREIDVKVVTQTGEIKYYLTMVDPIKNEKDHVLFVSCISKDITERKLAEQSLLTSEERYRLINNASLDQIYSYDRENRFTYANRQLCENLKRTATEIIGKTYWELGFPEEQCRAWDELHRQVYATGSKVEIVSTPMPDGTVQCFEVNLSVVKNDTGANIGIAGVNRNITERKRAEEELHESEEKYRGVVENSPNAIAIYVEGKIVFVNNQCVVLMAAANKEELIGKSVIQFIHPDNRAMVIARMQQAAIDGKPLPTAEEKFIRLDGTSVDVEVRAVPTNYKQKPAVQLIVQDITERKIAEESLRLSEQTYRGILDSITEAVYVEDANGIFLDVNRAAEKMYGYTKEEFVGRTPEFLSAPGKNDLSQLAPLLEKALNGEPQYFEFWGRRKDGTIFPKDVSNSLGYYFGKKVNIAVARDITERKNNEQALRQAQKLESIGTLAGGIAHDFNNLMNAVLGQSALALQKLPKESPAANNIQKAIKAGERVADLTKQLLAYSGRGRFVIDEIDLNKLVKENVAMLEVSIPKTTQLRYELGNPSPHIMGDISQIQQVIMNLIINAGEAMGSHPGFITIHTNRIELPEKNSAYSKYSATPIAAGSYAMLQVKDNGSGISEETLARIFDPFFTTKFTGRGLGLAAVLGIIKGHKGGLRIESEVGKGTMFEIIWPLVEASTISNITEKKEIEVNGEGKTILVIDDEFTVIELVNDVLSEFNFKVMSALDPIKGIELYRQHHQTISMVVLDYSMPHMDGKAAFEKLLQINREVKVLLCSGYTEEETMSVFGIDRPTGFFHKPYMPDALLERVGEIIAKK